MSYIAERKSWLKDSASSFVYDGLDIQEIGIMDDGLQSLFVAAAEHFVDLPMRVHQLGDSAGR